MINVKVNRDSVFVSSGFHIPLSMVLLAYQSRLYPEWHKCGIVVATMLKELAEVKGSPFSGITLSLHPSKGLNVSGLIALVREVAANARNMGVTVEYGAEAPKEEAVA